MESKEPQNPPIESQQQEDNTNKISKKEAAKLERQRRRQEAAAATTAAISTISIEQPDPLSTNYGDVALVDLQSKSISGRKWTEVGSINPELKDQVILIRGRVQTIRPVGKKIAFVVVRERGFTVQCVLTVKVDLVSSQMVKYATSLSKESIVDIEGVVSIPEKPITGATQQQVILIRGRVRTIRPVGKKIAFVVVRERGFTVQCVLTVKVDLVSSQMVKYATSLSKESIVDIKGAVSIPEKPITGATQQQVEVQISKLYCVNRAVPTLPINIEDAARSEVEIEQALKNGEQLVRVNQDTRLNFRILDMRTPANQGIFRIQCQVENIFRQFLLSEGFVGIHTPKLIAGSSEGGSAVFRLVYKGGVPACLAQSPQLHKQMAICGDFSRVFEIGPVFRAEDSFTHRHLCEFTGLDVEMEIKEHYSEVMDIVDRLFVAMFDSLNENCRKELEAIGKQYPFEPLKYLRKTLRLTFAEGIQMLKEAGIEADPLGDLNTETERKLGQLVAEKYGTEFYILHKYPQAVRPFYTMPCHDNPSYSNSFDVFIRGEEIISGAQRIHVPEFLEKRAGECGIDIKTISTYIDSFRYGAPPHGGFGVGLERVVMLFCALNNIRKTSLFPRDPQRIAP